MDYKASTNQCSKESVTPTELNVNFMQKDKFEKAEMIMKADDAAARPPQVTLSPVDVRKWTASYYKKKAERLQEKLKRIKGSGLDLKQVSGLLSLDKVQKPKLSNEKVRVTQVCDSMEAKKVRNGIWNKAEEG